MTLPQSYFDDLYATAEDPWSFRTRRYERRKRALTLDALLEDRYATAFEPGCSIGTLTAQLATRCDHLIGMDISPAALEVARATVPDHVELVHGSLPDTWVDGRLELLVLSEVAYYLAEDECAVLAHRAFATSAEVVAVHWRHPVADYPLSGDEVHAILGRAAEQAGFTHAVEHLELDLRLDVWSGDPRSVAQRTFLDPA